MSKSNWREEIYLGERIGGAGTLVRQGIKVGGKKGGRAVQQGTTAATAAGKAQVQKAKQGNQKKMIGSGKYEKLGAQIGGLAGGAAGVLVPDGPAMVAGELAGGYAGSKIGGKIGRQFDKRSLKKEENLDENPIQKAWQKFVPPPEKSANPNVRSGLRKPGKLEGGLLKKMNKSAENINKPIKTTSKVIKKGKDLVDKAGSTLDAVKGAASSVPGQISKGVGGVKDAITAAGKGIGGDIVKGALGGAAIIGGATLAAKALSKRKEEQKKLARLKARSDKDGDGTLEKKESLLYDVVHDYIISENFAFNTEGANKVMLQLSDELMQEIYERTMTSSEKRKDTMLKKKYDDSDMKKNMQDQYGKEEGKKVYFATIRKQAMKKEETELTEYISADLGFKIGKQIPKVVKTAKAINTARKIAPYAAGAGIGALVAKDVLSKKKNDPVGITTAVRGMKEDVGVSTAMTKARKEAELKRKEAVAVAMAKKVRKEEVKGDKVVKMVKAVTDEKKRKNALQIQKYIGEEEQLEGYGSDRVGPALTVARAIDKVNPRPTPNSKRTRASRALKLASIKKDEKIRKRKENPYSADKRLKMVATSIRDRVKQKAKALTRSEEVVTELNRYEKEKGIDTKTKKPVTKGGTAKKDLAFQAVMKKYGSQRMGANEPKKVKGAKSDEGTGRITKMLAKKKEQQAKNKALASAALKAGYKSTQDYVNVQAVRKGGLGT